jgi:hypothetical protein
MLDISKLFKRHLRGAFDLKTFQVYIAKVLVQDHSMQFGKSEPSSSHGNYGKDKMHERRREPPPRKRDEHGNLTPGEAASKLLREWQSRNGKGRKQSAVDMMTGTCAQVLPSV